MNELNFCYWLDGLIEDKEQVNTKELLKIKDKLNKILKKEPIKIYNNNPLNLNLYNDGVKLGSKLTLNNEDLPLSFSNGNKLVIK